MSKHENKNSSVAQASADTVDQAVTDTATQPSADGAAAAAAAQESTPSVGRSAALMSVLVIISRITGFFRTWAQAYALGTTLLASCYTVANNLPNQLYELVVGGMLVTAFLPVYLSVKEKSGREGANKYISNLLSIIFIIMGVLTLVCIALAAPLVWIQSAGTDQAQMGDAVYLFRFFAIEVLLYCLSTIASGVLNAEREYLWSSASSIFNNFITIASFLLYAALSDVNQPLAMVLLALGNPLGVLVQTLVQLPALRKRGVHFSWHVDLHDPALKDTLAIGIPSLIVTACSFVTVSVMNSCALLAVPEQGGSIQYYARLWYTLPYAVLAVPITTAVFTEISALYAKGDRQGFNNSVTSGICQILFSLVPFMLYLIVFSGELMTLMRMGKFGAESASLTASYLSTLSLALPFYGLTTFFQKVFSSMRRMGLYALANVVASLVQTVFTVVMTPVIGIHAVSLGSALFMLVVDVVSFALLKTNFEEFKLTPVGVAAVRSLAVGALGAIVGMGILALLNATLGAAASPARALVYIVLGGVPALVVTFGVAIKAHIPEASFYSSALSSVKRRLHR